jgi:hypothetical protein
MGSIRGICDIDTPSEPEIKTEQLKRRGGQANHS